ncbi:MAG: glycosyltransferase [Candidatus Gracilibacteria bacterium]|nr:glycosyltransferase [Candidatus Gracilibacteria bacterium]
MVKKQRFCLPLMPVSVEMLDFSEYDVVIISSSGFAHGTITKPECNTIAYIHAPARYMWDWTNEYKKDLNVLNFIRPVFNYFLNKKFLELRQWDYMASKRPDIILANSSNTANRIKKYHRNTSEILPPPIEISRFNKFSNSKKGDYYIIISMLAHYKKIEVAINAFNKMSDKKLIIVGGGDYKETLEKMVTHPQPLPSKEGGITFVGPKYGDEMVELLAGARGFIFPGEEDFGMAPVEALACGTPLFALKAGGLLETNIEGITGEFFEDKDGKDFVENFKKFDENINNNKYKKEDLLKQANNFGEDAFEGRIRELVGE